MIVKERVRKGNTVIVVFDNNDKLLVPYDVFLKHYLSVDDEISEKLKQKIETESSLYKIKQSSFRYLSGRNHSTYELKVKLQKKQYDISLIQKVLIDLEKQGLLNDEEFAHNYYNVQLNKKRGLLQIKSNLSKKGISREIIETISEKLNNDDDFIDNAKEIAEKKRKLLQKRKLDDKVIKQKVFQFLASRGFTSNIIMETLKQMKMDSTYE
ncbi:MAG: recombination regulator RecX [Melioribacteraceae bacterium]|nr:recombination regulator RecX [Melioribacteraceae bacterium]